MKKHGLLFHRKIDLKRNYLIYYEIGLALALLLINLVFRINFSPQSDFIIDYNIEEEIVFLEDAIQTKQEVKVPPPPRPVVPIEVPNDEIIEDEIIFMSSELDFDDFETLPLPPPPKNDEEEEQEIFIVVEQPPTLNGGLKELQKKVVYPNVAIQAGIEGRVVVQFVINDKGMVLNPSIVRGIGGGCDEEAIRVIKLAKFTPGMQRGKPVSVRYTIPISFKLSED